jgi:LSD1 subclass zinc finger protein
MQIECPACSQKLSAPDGAAGQRVRCAKCKTFFVVPPPPKHPCPRCQTPLDPAAIICHRCGVNLQTGRTPADDAAEEQAENSEGVPRFEPARLVEFIEALLPGLFRFGILIRAVFFILASLVAFAMCVAFTMFGLVIEAPFVGGLGLILYAHALAMLITGERGVPHELLAEFNGKQWLLFLALVFGLPLIAYFTLRGYLPPPTAPFSLPGQLPHITLPSPQPTDIPP